MKKKILALSLVVGSSCTLIFGKKHSSEWAQLDEAGAVDCYSIPDGPRDLNTENVTILKGPGADALLVEVKQRDGSRLFRVIPFEGDPELDITKAKTLSISRNSFPVGDVFAGSGHEIAVVKNRSETASVLELHKSGNSVVDATSDVMAGGIRAGLLHSSPNGWWLGLQRSTYELAFVSKTPVKGNLPVKSFSGLNLQNRPALLPGPDRDSVVVLDLKKDGRRSADGSDVFRLHTLTSNGVKDTAVEVDLTTKEGVESWAAIGKPGGFALAYITGDTLIGKSDLNIASIAVHYGAGTKEWNRQLSLKNIHVSDPRWVAGSKGLWVLLLKWIDDESTLAAYKIGTAGIESTNHMGVFRKGTSLVDAFVHSPTGKMIAVLRSKDQYRWHYEICSLGPVD